MDLQESFLFLVEELARSYGISSSLLEEAKKNSASSSEPWRGSFEFSLSEEKNIKIHLDIEQVRGWSLLRLLIHFENIHVGPNWTAHHEFLEAFLLCQIIPGTFFPLVPMLSPHHEMEWQAFLPLDAGVESYKRELLDLLKGALSFYEEATKLVHDLGFRKELVIHLRRISCSSGLAWTLGEWERQKLKHPNASHSIETYSSYGNYYRLLPPNEQVAGMIAINLGNLSDFVGIKNIFSHLLQANAITFLSDHYYLSIDSREGLLLIALLPPAKQNEKAVLITALLQRAVAVRQWIVTMTNDLESIRIKEKLKKIPEIEELIFT
jgi:hypothetical protein